ncbi:MAG: response regulator [Chitinophagaceae bacterium]|nr:response regulator [Chitinophagaceae bacterium]
MLEQGNVPDVLFLDVNLPNLNGIECLKLIRSNTKFVHLPIVIYSTTYFKPTIEAALSLAQIFLL